MMRRILGDGVFGDVFWVYDKFPKEYAEASKANGIKTLSEMDKATTRALLAESGRVNVWE